MKKFEQWQDMLARLYPEIHGKTIEDRILSRTVTFQVTDACNLFCTYCYQINKGIRRMKFETAKKFIDMLLNGDKRLLGYVDVETSPGIILEFIGGEPFLEVELIDKICDYFYDTAIELEHPWAEKFCISICSNGVLGMSPKVQAFINKWERHLSYSITIDGNKELHDSCRVFEDGSGSYDLAVKAAKDWMDRGGYMGSKITIAPANLPYMKDAILHMVELGYDEINANVVYEEGWTVEHARDYYKQLKEIADYWINNNLVETHYLALFDDAFFVPMDKTDNDNWCGGVNSLMLSIDPDGYLYPCIRYMESSLGSDIEPVRIGHVDTGIAQCESCRKCLDMVSNITRRSQSTDECFNCPIAKGCSWCSAYNYQVSGSVNHRVTYICEMHKARSLANVYFWNKYYRDIDSDKRFPLYCPDEWALNIVSQEELDMLKALASED